MNSVSSGQGRTYFSFLLKAEGHDSRIDLHWEGGLLKQFNIYRSVSTEGPFQKIGETSGEIPVYSDFLGVNDLHRFYRITAINQQNLESPPSRIVSARSRAMTDEELLTSVQQATFRYFWDYGHPISGLARERSGSGDTCTSGGTGFGIMAIVVGTEREFVQRREAANRMLKMVRFLQQRARRYHGAWSHWINGRTGQTIPFSKYDDGADIVETSFLMQGLLTARQYFDEYNPTEDEIRRRIESLWRQVEWNWFLREPDGKMLYWHWSPNHAWKMNHTIGGHFNECMITYLLAIASPTFPIPASCYEKGWIGETKGGYFNGNTYYGQKQWVGWPMGGPLFFTHYSFLGFDPRGKRDRFCNYFENNRNISLIHQSYCAANPGKHKGYNRLLWGLTASDDPDGYKAHEPRNDNGTISPTAAISAMPYVPTESLAALKHFYFTYGRKIWGPFGFRDAFNLDRDWFAQSYLAIDQGPIIIMIENYRTGLCWKYFMANTEIGAALKTVGWKKE
ncbi:MAG: beta-glucosidase [Sedimentisphaerales bacterium]|nr:beta-glucosidase [Sedimentisphaerales bacterium]